MIQSQSGNTTTWSQSYTWSKPVPPQYIAVPTPVYVPVPVYNPYGSIGRPNNYSSGGASATSANQSPKDPGANATIDEILANKGKSKASECAAALKSKSLATTGRAEKLIDAGDTSFGRQQFTTAFNRYKDAAKLAPDMAEPQLRQGFALLAQCRYPQAAKAIRAGLEVRSDWHDSSWRLNEIASDEHLAKLNQQLVKAIDADPKNSDLLLAAGVQMYFTDQRDRAERYLARAEELGANDDHLLDSLLGKGTPSGRD